MKKIVSLVILLLSALAFTQLDWETRKVRAEGMGAPDSIFSNMFRSAETMAKSSLISQVKGAYLTSNTRVENACLKNDRINREIKGVAQFYEIIGDPVITKSGSLKLTLEMSLSDIDWRNKVVTAPGIGYGDNEAVAFLAAQMDGERRLTEMTKGMYLKSLSISQPNLKNIDVIVDTEVEGILRGANTKSCDNYGEIEKGRLDVKSQVKLGDNLEPIPGFAAIAMMDMQFDNNYPEVDKASYNITDKKAVEKKIYTSLIIDCRNINLNKALAPKIITIDSVEVYNTTSVSKSFATQLGMIEYCNNENNINELRVGSNPLKISAIKSAGIFETDIMISKTDAALITDAVKINKDIFGQCRVIALTK